MSEHQLPTEEDLQRLYDKRGHGEVITYAYRNALRALPFLVEEKDLTEVWRENTVEHFYNVVWGLLLIQWVRQQIKSFSMKRILFKTLLNTNYIYKSASRSALASCSVSASRSASSSRFASSSAYIPTSASDYAFRSAFSACYASSIYSFACNDFKYLQKGKCLPTLWYDSKPRKVVVLENKLIKQLNKLGLDFLAKDIQCLWEDKPLAEHAINYTKQYSETITNNAKKLRLAIIGNATQKLTATRVLLLGSGGAGKSTLANRLNNPKNNKYDVFDNLVDELNELVTEYKKCKSSEKIDEFDKIVNNYTQTNSATIGINYHNHKAIDLKPFGIEQEVRDDLQLYLWDFGGQSIFHGLHNAFLHENCVYVVVVDSRHEQAPDEWLYQIQNLVGDKKPPVLIVTNIYEKCNLKQNQTRLLREFDDLITKESFYYFPCNNPQENHQEEFDKFINQLVILALKNQHDIFSDMITIKNSIAEEFQNKVFISQNQLIEHIKTLPLHTPVKEEKIEDLMEDLRSLGFIVRLKEKSDIEQYCLKPEWTVDKAYTLLHKLREIESNGLAIANEIDKLIGIETSNNTKKLLDFLIDRKLCYLVGQNENQQYFFPDASLTDEPKKIKDISDENNRLQIRFSLPYMPLGLHARLVSKFFDFKEIKIQSPQDVWREGFIIKNENVQAVVSYYYRKSYVDFIFTGDIKHAGAIFKELHKEIADCLNIEIKEPTKKNSFQKISAFFSKKDKSNNNTQANTIVLSIISNDNKLTRTFSELPKLSYEDLRTAEKLENIKRATFIYDIKSLVIGIIAGIIVAWILNQI